MGSMSNNVKYCVFALISFDDICWQCFAIDCLANRCKVAQKKTLIFFLLLHGSSSLCFHFLRFIVLPSDSGVLGSNFAMPWKKCSSIKKLKLEKIAAKNIFEVKYNFEV